MVFGDPHRPQKSHRLLDSQVLASKGADPSHFGETTFRPVGMANLKVLASKWSRDRHPPCRENLRKTAGGILSGLSSEERYLRYGIYCIRKSLLVFVIPELFSFYVLLDADQDPSYPMRRQCTPKVCEPLSVDPEIRALDPRYQ
jgi:hypothetical protein